MALMQRADMFSEQLDELRRTLLGVFDTGLPCNCREANIMDHATQGRTPQSELIGPGPSNLQQLERFYVVHDYQCDSCGATYASGIVEGKRGYVPLDRKPKA